MLVTEARKLETSDTDHRRSEVREAIADSSPIWRRPESAWPSLLLGQDRADESRAIVDELEQRGFLEPEAEKLKAQLHVNASTPPPRASSTSFAPTWRSSRPTRQAARAGRRLWPQAKYEEALEIALSVVQQRNKEFTEPARELMVDIFHVSCPIDSELLTSYRRQLSTALY